jgi:hypothetical protein
MSERKLIIVPSEDDFKPAPIPFAVVTGDGVPDYDHMKSKGKRGGMQYSASVLLTKKERQSVIDEILEFWEENKPKKAGDEPANFKNIVRKDKEGDGYIMYAKSKTEFDGSPNVIPVVNHEGTKLDPAEYGKMGKGTKGRLAITLAVYGDDEDAGVSTYISAIKVTKFAPLVSGNAAAAFGKEDGEVDGAGGFKAEKAEKKDKKKKKKNK